MRRGGTRCGVLLKKTAVLPYSGRQHLFSVQQRANAVPSDMPSMGQTLALLLLELDAIVKMKIGLV